MSLPLSAIAIYRDIMQFKKTRSLDYLATLQIIAQKEMRLLSLYGDMLRSSHAEKKSLPIV